MGLDKRYITDVDLTSTTTTGDREGAPLDAHDAPAEGALQHSLELLRGEVELPIPAASAVKIGGERAYRLARRGVEVAMPLRRTQVYALDVIAYSGDTVRLALHVGSGTYVRAIAVALGGHCTTLRRTAVGPFSVDEAEPFGPGPAGGDDDAPLPSLIGVGEALGRLPPEALDRVPPNVVAGVLALDDTSGGEAA